MKGQLKLNEPMGKHVSWRAGGSVDRAYIPTGPQDLSAFMKQLPEKEPIYFVGLGSNLLVRDGGLQGTVILLHGALKEIHLEAQSGQQLIYAEAGVASPKVARFAARHDFEGAEFLAGIPGTVGGALAMNAGCYGSETWEIVSEVMTMDRQGGTHRRTPHMFEIGYRHVVPNTAREEWFVACWFKLPKGDGAASQNRIKELLQKRIASQPLNQPNAGSVFRNPPGDYAARLIEASGLKGMRIGGAMVSEKHANFIVNVGDATARDIEDVIEKVQQVVDAKQGVRLVQEVRIVGERV